MFTGCCTGRSQSVYSLIIVAKISAWWYVYVLRTNSRRIFVRLSASIPYCASSAVKAKYASDRTTPIIRSYLRTYDGKSMSPLFRPVFRVPDHAKTTLANPFPFAIAITQFNGISPTDHNDVNSSASLRRGYSYLRIISNDEWQEANIYPPASKYANIRTHTDSEIPLFSGIIIARGPAKNVQNGRLLLIERLYKDFHQFTLSFHLGKGWKHTDESDAPFVELIGSNDLVNRN